MAKEKTAEKSAPAIVAKADVKSDRQERWEAHLAEEKAYNPSVYDTRGGDKQIAEIPESFK